MTDAATPAHTLNPAHITDIGGRPHVQYIGLIDLATRMGLQSIRTQMEQAPTAENDKVCIMRAEVTMADGRVFTGYGDAGPASVSARLLPHSIRFAETRAKARGLRDATNVSMTTVEEQDIDQILDEQLRGASGGRPAPAAQPRSSAASRNDAASSAHQPAAGARAKGAAKPPVQIPADMPPNERAWHVATLMLPDVEEKRLHAALIALLTEWSEGQCADYRKMDASNTGLFCALITGDGGAKLSKLLPGAPAGKAPAAIATGVRTKPCSKCQAPIVWLEEKTVDKDQNESTRNVCVEPAGVLVGDAIFVADRHKKHWQNCKR